jgi:hypothetical protein
MVGRADLSTATHRSTTMRKTIILAIGACVLALSSLSQADAHRLSTRVASATTTPRNFRCKGYGGRDGKLVQGTLSATGIPSNVTVRDWTGNILEATVPSPAAGSNPVKDASGATIHAYDFPGNTYWIVSTHAYPTSGHELWSIILPTVAPAGPTFTAIYSIRTIFFSGVACTYV